MEICAALYGFDRLQFLADNANAEADVAGILRILKEGGVELQSQKNAGKPNSELGFMKGETWGGSLVLSPQRGRDGIDSHIKIAMLPYISALTRPLFMAGHFVGNDITDKFLQTYSFPQIITIDDPSLEKFKAQFPKHYLKYGARAQTGSEINQSIGLLTAAVPELRYR